MQSTQTPTLVPLAFAANGTKNTIPEASQISITPGAASLNDGFPPLTMTPIAAGGVPPAGADFNGVLNLITQSIRWAHAGGGYTFNNAFATDVNVSGYPKGSALIRADLTGYWLNTTDGNTTNPDATDGSAAGWVPGYNYGVTAITGLTNANVTLSPLQAAKSRITLAGALTGSISVVLPAWTKDWIIVNNTTGAFSVTATTAAGSGVVLPGGATKVVGDGTNITQAAENVPTAPVNDNSGAPASTRWLWMNIQSLMQSAIGAVATAAGFEFLVAQNGYIRFPTWLGSLIIQWGLASSTSAAVNNAVATLPISFQSAGLIALAVITGNAEGDYTVQAENPPGLTVASFTCQANGTYRSGIGIAYLTLGF